uniref:non-specific serine/threonine protein kinase n=1 Tax=Cyprinus carpio TaxID=7962 RepID=A0A8C1W8C8_CYPCA
ANVTQTPVRTVSEWSIDLTHTPDCSTSDWTADVTQNPACTMSDWSTDITQTPSMLDILTNLVFPLIVINSCYYVIGSMLGEGTFGAVYEASRLQDGFKPLPLEVALVVLVNRGPCIPEIIQLLDWQDQHDHYIMVMERSSPCEDLFSVAERHGGSIDEILARVIMRQATQAAYMCCFRRGILHSDIKLENPHINKKTHEVKLIDFGCGNLLKKSAYKICTGTDQYCLPEYKVKGEYNGKPATVWSLGVLLLALVCGDYPNTDDLNKTNANNFFKAALSEGDSCLQREPEQRL